MLFARLAFCVLPFLGAAVAKPVAKRDSTVDALSALQDAIVSATPVQLGQAQSHLLPHTTLYSGHGRAFFMHCNLGHRHLITCLPTPHSSAIRHIPRHPSDCSLVPFLTDSFLPITQPPRRRPSRQLSRPRQRHCSPERSDQHQRCHFLRLIGHLARVRQARRLV